MREVEDLQRKLDENKKLQAEAAGPAEKVGLSEFLPPRPLHLLEDDDQVLVVTCHPVSSRVTPCHPVSPCVTLVIIYIGSSLLFVFHSKSTHEELNTRAIVHACT